MAALPPRTPTPSRGGGHVTRDQPTVNKEVKPSGGATTNGACVIESLDDGFRSLLSSAV